MDILGYARPFAFDVALPLGSFQFAPHPAPRVKPDQSTTRRNQRGNGQRAKPPCLPEIRQHFKADARASLVPNPGIVARYHFESVAARRNVIVRGETLRSGVHPIRIETNQPALETHFFRYGEAQARILKFKPMAPGRYLQGFLDILQDPLLVIDRERFDPHWRWQRVGSDTGRIYSHQSFGSGKPQSSVGGFASGRLQAFRTLQRGQTIVDAVSQARHFCELAVGTEIQIGLARPDNAAVGTHPQITPPVRFDVADDVVGQALIPIDHGKMPVRHPAQTAAEGSYPQRSFAIKMEALDEVTR